jgi:flavin reductase (DIM6/NTAB) family NADH-FMN oxidoreductase RutF
LVSKDDFRSAVAHFATGVTVITTVDDEGQPHSMTANSFTSVCMEPPVVLVCVAHGTNTTGFLEKAGRFGVNILRKEQEELGGYFAKRPEDRQGDVDYAYSTGKDGVPFLNDSMVSFACQVVGAHIYGDHTIFLGEVEEIQQNESGKPLMFYRSRWYDPSSD